MTTHYTCPPGAAAAPDLARIKNDQQKTWGSADFSVLGVRLQLVAEKLCQTADLRAGERVLDVATGAGTTALAAARCWTDVVGVDFVPALLDRARERAAAERLPIDFREGDSENLPFDDGSFDTVLSTFGAMFAPDQERVARELLRVCRKGGKIALANWTPEGWIGEMFRIIAKYVPPPAGLESPLAWGREPHLRKLFGAAASAMRVERATFAFRHESFDRWLDMMRTYYGPMRKTFLALDVPKQLALTQDLAELMTRRNRSGDATLVVDAEYLEVVVTKAA